eukprot:scaffold133193_cov26-Tisochrysis_lutea.AAC.1
MPSGARTAATGALGVSIALQTGPQGAPYSLIGPLHAVASRLHPAPPVSRHEGKGSHTLHRPPSGPWHLSCHGGTRSSPVRRTQGAPGRKRRSAERWAPHSPAHPPEQQLRRAALPLHTRASLLTCRVASAVGSSAIGGGDHEGVPLPPPLADEREVLAASNASSPCMLPVTLEPAPGWAEAKVGALVPAGRGVLATTKGALAAAKGVSAAAAGVLAAGGGPEDASWASARAAAPLPKGVRTSCAAAGRLLAERLGGTSGSEALLSSSTGTSTRLVRERRLPTTTSSSAPSSLDCGGSSRRPALAARAALRGETRRPSTASAGGDGRGCLARRSLSADSARRLALEGLTSTFAVIRRPDSMKLATSRRAPSESGAEGVLHASEASVAAQPTVSVGGLLLAPALGSTSRGAWEVRQGTEK